MPSAGPETELKLFEALDRAAQRHPGVEAYIDGERSFTFAQAAQASEHLATALWDMGLRRGGRIALLSPNRIEWLQLFFAAARIGVAVVALSPRYRDSELAFMLADSACQAVFTVGQVDDFDCAGMFERLAPRLPALQQVVTLDGARFAAMAAAPVRRDLLGAASAAVRADDLAMVIYTSGTTGQPKGCALTHASMLASAWGQARHTGVRPGELLQLGNPLNHVGGITCGVLSQLLAGGSCELVGTFRAQAVLDMVRRRPPALLVGVPTMLTLLLMHPSSASVDLGSVRLIVTGGSNADATLLAQLKARMPGATVMNLYGLSESSGALVMSPADCADDDLMQAIGQPLQGVEVQVRAPGGAVLAPGEIGELCFRGLGVVPGYIGAAAGAGAFGEGWLHTGDLGVVDARGFITLKGRMKDMYIQGGFNVYPAEVEALIASHPDVLMVAGIGVPDAVLGEVGRYFVVPRDGRAPTVDALLAHCAGRIADYKMPRHIVLREQLPLTPAGKIHKARLRDEPS